MAYIEPNSTLHLLSGINIDQDYNHTLFFQSRDEQARFFLSKAKKSCQNLTYTRKGRGVLRIDCVPEEVYGCNYMMYKNTAFNPKDIDRWIYAFVNRVEYVNNKCAEVYFTVDRMQTWMFDYVLGDCLVEREHTLSDVVGEYITPEDVSPFDMTICYENGTFDKREYSTFAAVVALKRLLTQAYSEYDVLIPGLTVDWTPVRSIGQSTGDVYFYLCSGLNTPITDTDHYLTSFTDLSNAYTGDAPWLNPTLTDFLSGIAKGKFWGKGYGDVLEGKTTVDDIIDVYIFPLSFFETNNVVLRYSVSDAIPVYSKQDIGLNIPTVFKYDSGDEYSPRNAKLFTSPFCYITAATINGDNCQFKYELFGDPPSGQKYQFRIQTPLVGDSVCLLSPRFYHGQANYFLSTLPLQYPMKTFYQSSNVADYLRNNSLSILTSALTASVGLIGGATEFAALEHARQGYLSNIDELLATTQQGRYVGKKKRAQYQKQINANVAEINKINEQEDEIDLASSSSSLIGHSLNILQAAKCSNKIYGGTSTGNADAAMGRCGYFIYSAIPLIESAKQIDDYFDRFGYKLLTTHRPYVDCAKTKDISKSSLRKYWNYIKTVDCVVHHANNNSIEVGYSAEDESIIASIYNKGITFWFDNDIIGEYNSYRGGNSIFNPSPVPPAPTPEPFPDNVLSGIDISRFQSSCNPYNPDTVYGVMDVETLMLTGNGPQFCIARAGGSDGADGTIFKDPVFEDGVLDNGNGFSGYASQLIYAKGDKPQIKVGIYWATGAESVEEIQNEMSYLYDMLNRNNLIPEIVDLGIFLDLELARTLNTGAANCDAIYRAFAEIVSGWGYTPWLYTFRSALQNNFISSAYYDGTFKVAISAPYNEDINYTGTPPTNAINDVSSGAYTFIPETRGIWQYGKSNRWVDYNGAYMDGDYFYWKGVSQ